jgi:hypothetical protein
VDGILTDFTDGAIFTRYNRIDNGQQNRHLSLILYQDSFEVANPIGSAKCKYEILKFLFCIRQLALA